MKRNAGTRTAKRRMRRLPADSSRSPIDDKSSAKIPAAGGEIGGRYVVPAAVPAAPAFSCTVKGTMALPFICTCSGAQLTADGRFEQVTDAVSTTPVAPVRVKSTDELLPRVTKTEGKRPLLVVSCAAAPVPE